MTNKSINLIKGTKFNLAQNLIDKWIEGNKLLGDEEK